MGVALPPYDLIAFLVTWVIFFLVVVGFRLLCCRRRCDGSYSGDPRTSEEVQIQQQSQRRQQQQQQNLDRKSTTGGGVKTTQEEEQKDQSNGGDAEDGFNDAVVSPRPPSSSANDIGEAENNAGGVGPSGGGGGIDDDLHRKEQESRNCRNRILLLLVAFPVCCLLSFLLWLAIFASAAEGLLDVFLFTPKPASDCLPSGQNCSTYNADGTVDESCCSYFQSTGFQQDVYVATSFCDGAASSAFCQKHNMAGVADTRYLHGWLMQNTTAAYPGQPRRYILYCHGSGNNVAAHYRLLRYRFYLEQGNTVFFTFDYSGYGKSSEEVDFEISKKGDGDDEEDKFTVAAQVKNSAVKAAAFFADWVRADLAGVSAAYGLGTAEAPLRSFSAFNSTSPPDLRHVTLLGRSLGGCMATHLGSITNWNVKGLVLQSTFKSPGQLTKDYLPLYGFLLSKKSESIMAGYSVIENLATLNTTNASLCVYHSHGTADEWVLYQHALDIQALLVTRDGGVTSTMQQIHHCRTWFPVVGGLHTEPLTSSEKVALSLWLNGTITLR